MLALERANLVCDLARRAGFERAGVAPAVASPRADYLRAWLESGCAGEMEYLGRWQDLRADPRRLLPGARSVVVVAHVYGQKLGDASKGEAMIGRVAQYAWGRDYHKVIRKKLRQLLDDLRRAIPEPFEARVCVDTAPVLERELAAAAGVGWIGKNTLVLNQELGSFLFLGEIVTTLDLAPSAPAADHCGTCMRCLSACPTGALVAPYQMDARRCISYLTIEHRGDIPGKLQPMMDSWFYGCDICQDVCPHNRKAPVTREPAYRPGHNPLAPFADPKAVLAMTPDQYRQATSGSAMRRASLEMLQRNAKAISARASGGY